jgi:hypothetical protein
MHLLGPGAEKIRREMLLGPEEEEDEDEKVARGQGYRGSSKDRKRIEEIAMNHAKKYFVDRGYDIDDVHLKRHYDLKCTKGEEKLLVEVKGTTGKGKSILLTGREVEFVQDHPKSMALVIVHSINLKSKRDLENGERIIVEPWLIAQRNLRASHYVYEMPKQP